MAEKVMKKNQAVFHPIIGLIQKIKLYETKSKYYLVGTNNTQTKFRVLKIDRNDPKELKIYDDKVEYGAEVIHDLEKMIDQENWKRSGSNGSSKAISAFGIVGFIRFLEGYYIILITKRQKAAVVGYHTIYKIKDTNMIYIPHESIRVIHPEEPRYVKMFQSIDLASNFYFSYSYDITHSLQHNLTNPKQFVPMDQEEYNCKLPENSNLLTSSIIESSDYEIYGIRTKPQRKFVWNSYLLKYVQHELHPDWILYITHGFVGQSNVNIFGRSVYVTLIARRSTKYAGTRFLKRGANFQGDVANEVETEQMVHDSGVSSFSKGHFTSFLQMRGSIPGHWKQEIGKMVAKPAIAIDLFDPYAETAGAHFNELLKRYGSPIIVLNLVKRRERKQQERMISLELRSAIKYLNQFLPVDDQIVYKTFDMARKTKKNVNVLKHLADIAKGAIQRTGIFHNHKNYFSQKSNTIIGSNAELESDFHLQTGIVRTNCVDCLDRTNTAQFAIGKCVLGYQLCALGILDNPNLEFDTDCVRMLESLYEDHGDTLALQYGGSQLVHRVKTYRKTAPWTSQGNDIMQTLSRYYRNTFSDAEKQNTINLFLGVFIPEENNPQIWDYTSDYYFHHKPNVYNNKSLTQWYDENVLKCLPYAYNDMTKACFEIIRVHSHEIEMIDAYSDYHRPFELSFFEDAYAMKISNSLRDFMPNCTIDYSPFMIRIRPVRRREENFNKAVAMKNPSVTGQSFTSSTTSSASSGSDEDSADDDDNSTYTNESQSISKESTPELVTFKRLFPSMEKVYGTKLRNPKKADILIYKKYVLIGMKANGTYQNIFGSDNLTLYPLSKFKSDTSFEIQPPKVNVLCVVLVIQRKFDENMDETNCVRIHLPLETENNEDQIALYHSATKPVVISPPSLLRDPETLNNVSAISGSQSNLCSNPSSLAVTEPLRKVPNNNNPNNGNNQKKPTISLMHLPKRPPVDIEFIDLSYSVSEGRKRGYKTILKCVNGMIKSGELTGIMGPSGAGKSTLMNILAGYRTCNLSGCVLINGHERNLRHFRKMSCYIMQDDCLSPHLTVREAMTVSANLKLGKGITRADKKTIINEIVETLGLTECFDTFTSSISGGQRKRLSIALELVNNPPVMFFDEPTSGLDSASCFQCIALLKSLARGGRTVICTVHQPSARLFEMFDSLFMLAEGQCIYRGPVVSLLPFLSCMGLECPSYHNPADYVMEVACGEHGEYVQKLVIAVNGGHCEQLRGLSDLIKRSISSDIAKTVSGKVKEPNGCAKTPPSASSSAATCTTALLDDAEMLAKTGDSSFPTSCARQFFILFKRTVYTTLRDTTLTRMRLLAHIVIGVLLGIMYYDIGNDAAKVMSNTGCLFFTTMFTMFSAMMPTILTFPMEMSVFVREHLNYWYSLKAYYFAKTLADVPFQIALTTCYIMGVYYLTSQPFEPQRFGMVLLVAVLTALVSQSFGLLVGAAFSIEAGVFLGPISTIPMVLFSGFFANLNDIPLYLRWLPYASYVKYSFEATMISIYGLKRPKLDCNVIYCHFKYPKQFLKQMAMQDDMETYLLNVLVLCGLFVVIRISAYFMLRIRLFQNR